jgi:hypothetical protein
VLPDLKIRAANLDEEFEFLRVASGDKFVFKRNFDDNVNPTLYTLEPSQKFLQETANYDTQQVEVFNFSPYFALRLQNPQPMDDNKSSALKYDLIDMTKQIVRTTVNSVCGASRGETLNFQFHPGANLLVVTGQTAAVNVAKKVINAMIEQPNAPAPVTVSVQRNGQSPSKVTALPDGGQLLVWPDVSTELRLQNPVDPSADRHLDIIQPAPPGANFNRTNR